MFEVRLEGNIKNEYNTMISFLLRPPKWAYRSISHMGFPPSFASAETSCKRSKPWTGEILVVDGKNLRMATALTPGATQKCMGNQHETVQQIRFQHLSNSCSILFNGFIWFNYDWLDIDKMFQFQELLASQMRGFLISDGSWNRQTWGSETASGSLT